MQVVLLHKDINLIKALIGIFVQLRGTEYTVDYGSYHYYL